MQRKSGFPVANCNIKMPDNVSVSDSMPEEDGDQQQRRQQLINFGHTQWGFNNWSWSLVKQDLDFVDYSNGKYSAGVAAFVSVTVKTSDIHRENVGYATCNASIKGSAIHQARKCAVTNALRETLLSFGGQVASELLENIEMNRVNEAPSEREREAENNQNVANKHVVQPLVEPKNAPQMQRKESLESPSVVRQSVPAIKNAPLPRVPAVPPAPRPAPTRPNSNVSFVLQPVMGGVVPPMYAPQRLPPPPAHVFPNYYEYPWHFAYEPYERHGNVNLNFNVPPKNLVVNGRGECKPADECRGQGCWIKPTIFYDGFWTEQKVKKWVAEQVEKQFPEEMGHVTSPPHQAHHTHPTHPANVPHSSTMPHPANSSIEKS